MVRGDNERLEVVVVGFDVRPVRNPGTGGGEDGLNPLQSAGPRMQAAAVLLTAAGQRDIDCLRSETSVNRRSFQAFPASADGLLDLVFGAVNFGSSGRAIFGRKFQIGRA